MQDNLEQVVQCHKCNAKVFSKVWLIHEIMCNRNQQSTKHKKEKKEKSMISKFKSLFGEEEQQEQNNLQPLIPCLQCGQSFPFSTYAIHEQQCIGHQLTLCKQCGLKFPTFLFDEHTKVCEGNNYLNEQNHLVENDGLELEEQIQEEENEQNNQILQAAISNIAIRQELAEQGLTKVQLANLKPHFPKQIEDCSICCTEMRFNKQWIIRLNCGHVFHKNCVNAWLAKNPLCPMCRTHALHK